jgi:flagellar hook-associated protein 2
MGTISSGVGLVTGFDIAGTVDKLIALKAAPRDRLTAQNTAIQNQQGALTSITAQLLSLQTTAKGLLTSTLYTQRSATSNNVAITATVTGTPNLGTVNVQPLRLAQAQQLTSSAIASDTSPLVATANTATLLDRTKSGTLFPRGKIKITDRSGAAATIDLAATNTIGDVITAINSNGTANVTASLVGNHLLLTDSTNAIAHSLTVEEVDSGNTAAALGLAGINFATNTANGIDVAALGAGTFSFRYGGYLDAGISLDQLNSGAGVPRGSIKITDRSGASATIDLTTSRTVDDVISAIGSNSSIRVTASASGNHLILTDASGSTSSSLKVEEVGYGTTAAALGLGGINVGSNTATGSDVLKLFSDIRLNSLNSGRGVRLDGALNDLQISFRDGTSTTVDLKKLAIPGTTISGVTNALSKDAQIKFTATKQGRDYLGATVVFINDSSVQKGTETVNYDSNSKTLQFHIRAGQTTANDVITALGKDTTASALFTAAKTNGGSGNANVSAADTATLTGPNSSATLVGSLSTQAQVQFTAVNPGNAYDGISIHLVNNNSIQQGQETAAYDSNAKTLTFQIVDGVSTANDIIAALQRNTGASAVLSAVVVQGTTGNGHLAVADTTVTAGAAIVAPIAGTDPQTLGDILTAINAAAPTKVSATISTDGSHIEFKDLTTDSGGTFSLTDLNSSHVAADLGLGAASGDTISGKALLAGLKSTLLSNLKGGAGIGTLGTLNLTNRAGVSVAVDLSSAVKVEDVVRLLNGAGNNITASLNGARNGVLLTDSSNGNGNLIVANGDATNTATKLGIAANVASSTVNSGDFHLQTVSESTFLTSLNGGRGVGSGSFTLTDTSGASASLTIGSTIKTVGDVIHAINALATGVKARVNDNGDGILLYDTALGANHLKVSVGTGTAANDLHFTGPRSSASIGGSTTDIIDGSNTTRITVSSSQSLNDLVAQINGSTGINASVVNDGTTVKPFRLTLTSQASGYAGQIQVDASDLGLGLTESAAGQDALLLVNPTTNGGGVITTSSTNTFTSVVNGLSLTTAAVATAPVSVTVSNLTTNLSATVLAIVNTYNKLQTTLSTDTAYDASAKTGGVLQSDSTALRVETDLGGLFSSAFANSGSVRALADLGVTVDTTGQLKYDSTKLNALVSSNPDGVKQLLFSANTGLGARIGKIVDDLASNTNSLLNAKLTGLTATLQNNQDRLDRLNSILDTEKTRLTTQFQNMELAVARIKANSSAITSLASFAASITGSSSTTSSSTKSSG